MKAGFKAPVRPRIRDELWIKLWGNMAFNPVSALTGATLDKVLADAGRSVTLWARRDSLAQAISHDHVNPDYLPNVELPASLAAAQAKSLGVSTAFVFGAFSGALLLMGLLGALLTFAGTPIYAPHFGATMLYGLTPLEDQQNAGLIMWAPAAARSWTRAPAA